MVAHPHTHTLTLTLSSTSVEKLKIEGNDFNFNTDFTIQYDNKWRNSTSMDSTCLTVSKLFYCGWCIVCHLSIGTSIIYILMFCSVLWFVYQCFVFFSIWFWSLLFWFEELVKWMMKSSFVWKRIEFVKYTLEMFYVINIVCILV